MTLKRKRKLKLNVFMSTLKAWMGSTDYLVTLIHKKQRMHQQQMNFPSKRKDEYLIRDPNLNIHFKIKNGVRYWLTPPPSNYKK